MSARHRLAVWGDPIDHSKSPQLHTAAYDVLGLDWEYTRRRVDESAFPAAVSSLDASWRGLSLTMPLKEPAYRSAVQRDAHAELTGAVNTLLLTDGGAQGFNTDVGGIVDALADQGVADPERVRVLGAGATAASALVAAVDAGARSVEVRSRRPERAVPLREIGERLGVDVRIAGLDERADAVDLTIATLPGGTTLDHSIAEPLAAGGGVLFDVAYSPWPSSLAAGWGDAPALSGEGMLLRQAVRQIRIFLHGEPTAVLPDEDAVVSAMRSVLSS